MRRAFALALTLTIASCAALAPAAKVAVDLACAEVVDLAGADGVFLGVGCKALGAAIVAEIDASFASSAQATLVRSSAPIVTASARTCSRDELVPVPEQAPQAKVCPVHVAAAERAIAKTLK